MNETLMRIVVEDIVFFGMSNENVIDQDRAVSQLEAIGSMLKDLDDASRQRFIEYVNDLAQTENNTGSNPERVEFLMDLCDNIGLI